MLEPLKELLESNYLNLKVFIQKIIYHLQAYDFIMCEYFCIGFIVFMFDNNSLIDFTNIFSENNFNENEE